MTRIVNGPHRLLTKDVVISTIVANVARSDPILERKIVIKWLGVGGEEPPMTR